MPDSDPAAACDRGGFRVPPLPPTNDPLPPAAVDFGGPFSHEFIHLRGVRLHVARAGRRDWPLVVLIHDALGGWFDFAAAIAPLAHCGWHVVAVDVRGYGLSDKPPSTAANTLRVTVGDITALIRALGYEEAVLVGVDSGAAVAWVTAATAPRSVAALVSIAGAHPTDTRRALGRAPWRAPGLIARTAASRLPGMRHLPRPAATWLQDRTLRRGTGNAFRGTSRFQDYRELRRRAVQIAASWPAIVDYARLPTAAVPSSWDNPHVECPVLVLQRPRGRWRGLARRVERRASAGLSYQTIPDARFLPHAEAPQQFAAIVDSWLRTRC